jgi:hypothetical protein
MSLTGVILVLYFREYILPTVVSRQRQFAECPLCARSGLRRLGARLSAGRGSTALVQLQDHDKPNVASQNVLVILLNWGG